MAFVMDNCEQLDVTEDEERLLVQAGLIYHPEEGNPYYYTTPWDVSLDDLEVYLRLTTRDRQGL